MDQKSLRADVTSPDTTNPGLVFATEMQPMDYLMFRGELEPRSRTSILSVLLLDRTPDVVAVRDAFERASRRVIRLRQRVVVPTLPVGPPHWIVDPDFDIEYHVRRISVAGPGSLRQVLDLAQVMLAAPLDTTRPLWECTLVEGLDGGDGAQAALLLKLNHAITDGIGGVHLFGELYDRERNADRGPLPPVPVPVDITSDELARQAARRLPVHALMSAGGRVNSMVGAGTRLARDPARTIAEISRFVGSARRVLGPPPVAPSPLLRRRGMGRRFEYLEFPLDRLKRAAKSAGGSVNDAYLAGLSGAMRRYHEQLGVPIDAMPMAIPVNLRTDDDPAGGNRFAGARLAVPVDEPDPAVRIALIRQLVLDAVDEPAITSLNIVAPVLTRLPTSVLSALSTMGAATDVQASNVPGLPYSPFIAGAQVIKTLPFGPLPGVAMMAVLVSEGGTCFLGVHYDTSSISDQELFSRCLREGFEEVLALAAAAPPTPRARRRKKAPT